MATSPDFSQQPPEMPKKSGGGKKVLIILGVVLGGLVLCCCCGIGGTIWYVAPTSDPAKVRSRATEIIELKLPDDFKPEFAANIPFVMKTAGFSSDSGPRPLLFIGGLGTVLEKAPDDQIRTQLQQSMQQQGQQNQIQVEKSEPRKIDIHGQPIEFIFAKGKSMQNNSEFWQVSGIVPGKNGRVMILIMVPADTWDEAKIEQLIQTIQ